MDEERVFNLLKQAISKFDISLEQYAVLTEAASGYFCVTPLLAAMAGATKVFAMARDSKYGKADDVAKDILRLAAKLEVENRIEIIYSRDDPRISEADIVTNLGFVRPIDAAMIRNLKKTAVISLMWETWEFRSQDLDIDLSRSMELPVLGTNEHHPNLKIFGYIGHVVTKLLYELEIEVFKSNVVIIGGGEFVAEANIMLNKLGASCKVIPVDAVQSDQARLSIQQADALVVLEHQDRRALIGPDGLISAKDIYQLNPSVVIAHVCGGVNQEDLESTRLKYLPKAIASAGYMSVSTSYVGPRPVIELHAAGLKVGQSMADAVAKGLRGLAAEKHALDSCEYAQGFDGRH